ncbi:hypothetical protein ACFRCG_41850 [Embleya sp. NPDC056575]|uniref:hypothetical protein n=1 Tax=unclassified Embleya TaxID=2699296 RepID=UPI0036AB8AAC
MGKKFTAFVHVDNGAGRSGVFSPGDPMPEWAEAHVANPKVWAYDNASVSETPQGEGPDEPPRSGPGSGKSAWAEYALSRGLEVTDDMSREDIIAAVDAAREE